MKPFKFSKRSLSNLEGVDKSLVEVMHRALELTSVDFAVTEGLRTVARQKQLVAQGASKTMNSRHLTGHAVDVMAFIGSRGSWELPLYYKIAEAVRAAAIEQQVSIRWGGAWTVSNIIKWDKSMEDANKLYVAERISQDRSVFIDGPHFELV